MNRGFALLIGATLVLLAACSTTDAPVALNDNGGLAPSSIAVVATEQQKLTASDSAAGSRFGSPVAIDGDTAIISSFQTRSAYIFTSDGTAWTEQAKLTTVLSGGYDYFGVSVALDGDTAIVGARQDGEKGFLAGAAYVFTRDGTTWTEQAKLTASNASPWAQFGASVAIDGDTAIIGANRGVADDGSTSGSAYVFTRVGTTWTEHARITASDAAPADNFGYSVAMDGDTAIIGAISDDDGAPSSGSAYVFTNDGATWTEQAKLAATDPFSLDLFGNTVAIDGDTAIIGSYNVRDDRSGSAYIFTRDGTTWTEQAKLTASDAATEDYFGWSVSIDGHAAIIGAAYDDDDGEFSGSAYIFTRDGTTWTERAKITASDAATEDFFGYAVAIDGDTAIIGSVLDDDGGTDSGSAYVYSIAPELAIQNLIANVDALASAGTLKRGQANGLTRPLENALRSLSRDGTEAACNQLTDFMTEVGLKTPEPLPQVEADAILASADSIRDALGCSAF